jgi:hypothetical protein
MCASQPAPPSPLVYYLPVFIGGALIRLRMNYWHDFHATLRNLRLHLINARSRYLGTLFAVLFT